jgi:hypothetical protein
MKHGHKKGKGKASPAGKKSKPAAKDKASKGVSAKKSPAKVAATGPAGKADAKGRGSDPFSFNNPIVAAAFRRAVKKYPSAFRRLTD